MEKHIETLITRSAEKGVSAAEAMHYSQAAVNAANALAVLVSIKRAA